MTHDEKRAYMAHHCGNRSVEQCAKALGVTTREAMDIYDEVYNLPAYAFPRPESDGLKIPAFLAEPAVQKHKCRIYDERVVKMWQQGKSAALIAEACGLNPKTVYVALKRNGLLMDNRRRTFHSSRLLSVIDVNDWISADEIFRRLPDISKSAVRSALTYQLSCGRIESALSGKGHKKVYRRAK